jgi:cytochrome c1
VLLGGTHVVQAAIHHQRADAEPEGKQDTGGNEDRAQHDGWFMHCRDWRALAKQRVLSEVVCMLFVCTLPMAATAATAGAQVGVAERGRLLLAQYQCGSCHTIPQVAGARGTSGPLLVAFGRRSYIAGHVPNRPEALVRWIVNPAAVVPGTTMPSMGVSERDARDMAAFLHTLR